MTDDEIIDQIELLSAELHRRFRKARRHGTRAERVRRIPDGGFADFKVDGDTGAASVRSSAYQVLGKGRTRCERISACIVRVHRFEKEKAA